MGTNAMGFAGTHPVNAHTVFFSEVYKTLSAILPAGLIAAICLQRSAPGVGGLLFGYAEHKARNPQSVPASMIVRRIRAILKGCASGVPIVGLDHAGLRPFACLAVAEREIGNQSTR